jgi:hypothetical protein
MKIKANVDILQSNCVTAARWTNGKSFMSFHRVSVMIGIERQKFDQLWPPPE